LRDHLKIHDDNFFVTSWVVENLLEAKKIAPKTFFIDPSLLINAATALNTFHDKNRPNTDAISFWPQKFDASQNIWTVYPANFMEIIGKPSQFLAWALDICLKILPAETCIHVSDMVPDVAPSFAISSDNDDSALNLIIGESLAQSDNAQAFGFWRVKNSDEKIANYLRLILKYRYQASSSDYDKNMLDPLSYYVMRNAPQFDTSPYLTTWLSSISEEKDLVKNKPHTNPKVIMQFNVND
jgi:hypothetical protein